MIKQGIDDSIEERDLVKNQCCLIEIRGVLCVLLYKSCLPQKVLNNCDLAKYVKMTKKSAITDRHKRIQREIMLKWITGNMD